MSTITNIVLTILLVLSIVSCSTINIKPDDTNTVSDLKQELVKFAKEDVTEALKMAVEDDDVIAAVCWNQVAQFLARIPESTDPQPQVKGAASAFQKARGIARKVDKGPEVPVELRLGCSALFTDTNVLAARLRTLGR